MKGILAIETLHLDKEIEAIRRHHHHVDQSISLQVEAVFTETGTTFRRDLIENAIFHLNRGGILGEDHRFLQPDHQIDCRPVAVAIRAIQPSHREIRHLRDSLSVGALAVRHHRITATEDLMKGEDTAVQEVVIE